MSGQMLTQSAYSQSAEPPPETVATSIAVEYAKACLELAEVELRRAESLNERVPNIVPRVRLEGLRRNVQLDLQEPL